jgi:hypothetical protein
MRLTTKSGSKYSGMNAPNMYINQSQPPAINALITGLVEASGAMQRAAIIPNHALAWAPPVRINTGRWHDHQVEFLDQRAAFFVIHAFDPLGMIAKKYRLPPGVWMCAHDWMCDWRLREAYSSSGSFSVR